MKNILEIIVLYIYINVYSFQIISIDYMQLSNSYNIQYRIDQLSNRHEYAAIDLSFDYTLLVIPNFTPYYTYIRKNILLLNETRNILEYESKLELSESQLQLDLPVNIIDNIDDSKKYVESKIGLSYKYDDERFSIVHSLKQERIISHLSFAFNRVFSSTSSKPQMYFVGIPQTVKNKYKYKASFKVNESHKEWGINLLNVRIGNESFNFDYNNTFYSYLNTKDSIIKAPLSFMKFLNESIFNELYKQRKCSYRYGRTHSIDCFMREIDTFPTITFHFDGYLFSFNIYSLFNVVERGEFGLFLIQSNEYNDYQWVFGNMLFENYLTEFDYETHLITFYSSFPFKRDNNVVYTILLVNIIILFVMNIYSIIIKMNKFN